VPAQLNPEDNACVSRPAELAVIADQVYAPVPGGTGRYTTELLRALARTAPEGWSVTSVVSRRPDVSEAVIEGVEGPRVLPMPHRALVALWQAGVPYWPGGDAVHAPTPLAPPRKPRGKGPLAVTVHDTVPWSHTESLTRRGVNWHRSMVTRAMRRADVVVVPTQSVAHELGAQVAAGGPGAGDSARRRRGVQRRRGRRPRGRRLPP
jgi:glycosyltransferase involved in cell wall biosynthesis